jgi:hypothetical protein
MLQEANADNITFIDRGGGGPLMVQDRLDFYMVVLCLGRHSR